MSFVGDVFNEVTGWLSGGDEAAEATQQATQQALQLQQQGIQSAVSALGLGMQQLPGAFDAASFGLDQILPGMEEYLKPVMELGDIAGEGLQRLLTDPSSIYDDPIFQSFLQQGVQGASRYGLAGGKQFSGQGGYNVARAGMSAARDYFGDIYGSYMGAYQPGVEARQTLAGAAYNVGGMQANLPIQQAMAQQGVYSQIAGAHLTAGGQMGQTALTGGTAAAQQGNVGIMDMWSQFWG